MTDIQQFIKDSNDKCHYVYEPIIKPDTTDDIQKELNKVMDYVNLNFK